VHLTGDGVRVQRRERSEYASCATCACMLMVAKVPIRTLADDAPAAT
jgi:hypothetical protein